MLVAADLCLVTGIGVQMSASVEVWGVPDAAACAFVLFIGEFSAVLCAFSTCGGVREGGGGGVSDAAACAFVALL